MNEILSVGLILISALMAGHVAQLVRAPEVTGYLLIGIVIGPAGFDLISHENILTLSFLSDVALGLILFNIGAIFEASNFRQVGPGVARITLLGRIAGLRAGGHRAPARRDGLAARPAARRRRDGNRARHDADDPERVRRAGTDDRPAARARRAEQHVRAGDVRHRDGRPQPRRVVRRRAGCRPGTARCTDCSGRRWAPSRSARSSACSWISGPPARRNRARR